MRTGLEPSNQRGSAAAGLVVLVAIGLFAALMASSGSRVPAGLDLAEGTRGCPADPELVAERIEEIRGLEFERLPEIECLPIGRIASRLEKIDREPEPLPPEQRRRQRMEVAASAEVLRLSGLAPPDFDPGDDLLDSTGLETAGVYVPEADLVLVAAGSRSERFLAHELIHALEDQRFELDLAPTASSEADAGLQAVVEGSATYHELLYANRHLGSRAEPIEAIGARSLLEAPAGSPALAQYLLFPYLAGGRMIAELAEMGGTELIDEALRDPPANTEQVLHPEAWLEREPSRRLGATGAGDVLGRDWVRIGAGEAGEIDAILMLELSGRPRAARVAADGWEGGRYEAWRPRGPVGDACKLPCRGRRAAVISFALEGERDALELRAAAGAYALDGLGGRPVPLEEPPAGGGVVQVDAYAIEGGAVAVGTAATGSSVTFAPSAATAARLARVAARSAS